MYRTQKQIFQILERSPSAAALWCYRLAVFLIPFFIVVVLGYRWRFIDTPAVFWLLGLGALLLFLVLGLGVIGLYQLWQSGLVGGRKSIGGILLGLLMLAPYAWFGWQGTVLPVQHDITTDRVAPPLFEASLKNRQDGMNDITSISAKDLEVQFLAYPNVVPRQYAVAADRVYTVVIKLMEERGWEIVAEDIPEVVDLVDVEGSVRKHSKQAEMTVPLPRPESLQRAASPIPQVEAAEDIKVTYVEALARSLVFGFESDVIVRIVEQDNTALVDMRSASRWGKHDYGSNAARIEAFLKDLDKVLTGIAAEG